MYYNVHQWIYFNHLVHFSGLWVGVILLTSLSAKIVPMDWHACIDLQSPSHTNIWVGVAQMSVYSVYYFQESTFKHSYSVPGTCMLFGARNQAS